MNYRRRSLSAHTDAPFSRVRVRAGDRTPDVAFEKAGERVSLFQLIGSCGMIALLGPGENSQKIVGALAALHIRAFIVVPKDAGPRPAERLVDLYGDFAHLYGAQGPFLYLLRPDGHVALFQRRVEPGALAAYLKKIRTLDVVEKGFARS